MGHRILLVANRTLGGDHLTSTLRDRVAAGATELWIVVPVTMTFDQASFAETVAGLVPHSPPVSDVERAERRLRDATYRFRDLGIPVDGEVSDLDPFSAVKDVLARREFDEIIVSTLPTGVSHWLKVDLPGRVHRAFGVPVTTVTAR